MQRINFSERIFNTSLALFILVPAGIVMFLVYVVYYLTSKKTGPFLYKGIRLGKDRREFNIYKIRTLVINAEKQIGAKLYANDSSKELWYGGFLRNTRIDELPQLINVIKGDMDFVGPRPVRPLIYESSYKHISGIEKRFSVRPGLTGYSQFYTPHGAPARLRVLIDNYFIKKNTGVFRKVLFVMITAIQFLVHFADELVNIIILSFVHKRTKELSDRRRYRRRRVSNAFCEVKPTNDEHSFPIMAFVIDIDNESILLESPGNILQQNEKIQLAINYKTVKNGQIRNRIINCDGEIVSKREKSNKDQLNKYVIDYSKVSEVTTYSLHKHLLKASYAG